MATLHIQALLTSDRLHEWTDTDELTQLVADIPHLQRSPL